MRIRLSNPRGYTSEEVHAALMRATATSTDRLAMLGQRFLDGESSEDYPDYMREAVEDAQMITWALGQVWDGMASRKAVEP